MKKMISGWKHSKGVHCGSSAIRDVCRRSGHDFSEQMCFGLGGGLGFYYTRDRNTDPSRLIHLRGPMMEVSFSEKISVSTSGTGNTKTIPPGPWTISWDWSRGTFRCSYRRTSAISTTTTLRRIFRDTWWRSAGTTIQSAFFYVADNSFEDVQPVSYESMERSRNSKAEPYPLSNNWLEADLSGREFDLETAAAAAVRRNAETMLGGYATLRGNLRRRDHGEMGAGASGVEGPSGLEMVGEIFLPGHMQKGGGRRGLPVVLQGFSERGVPPGSVRLPTGSRGENGRAGNQVGGNGTASAGDKRKLLLPERIPAGVRTRLRDMRPREALLLRGGGKHARRLGCLRIFVSVFFRGREAVCRG